VNVMSDIQVIYDLSKEYFENNPESIEFELSKGVLGDRLNIGTTKTEAVCKALEGEYQFIKNDRGKLTIDKQSFNVWLELQNDKQIQTLKMQEIRMNYSQLVSEIEQLKSNIEKANKVLTEKQDEKDQLNNQLKELEQIKAEKDNELENIRKNIEAEKEAIRKQNQENIDYIWRNQRIIEEIERTKDNVFANWEPSLTWRILHNGTKKELEFHIDRAKNRLEILRRDARI